MFLHFFSQVFIILYITFVCFPFFFVFINAIYSFHLRKKVLTKKFFTETCVTSYFHFRDSSELSVSLWKKDNLMWLKTKSFLFILTDNHTKIREIIFSAMKNERSLLCDKRKYYVKVSENKLILLTRTMLKAFHNSFSLSVHSFNLFKNFFFLSNQLVDLISGRII